MISQLIVTFGLCVLGILLYVQDKANRREREALEDRLMAMSRPDALITHKALADPEPAAVEYVDEAREYALGNGNVDLLGDD